MNNLIDSLSRVNKVIFYTKTSHKLTIKYTNKMLTIISVSVNIYLNKKDSEDKSMSKKYEELGITDAFMFAKVMSNKEICKPVLE